jgi:transglutaminase-like putative cysteine protease
LLLALLVIALGSVALGLADTVRGLDAALLLPVAALGLLAGWGLAKSPLPGWLAGLAASGLGAEFIVVRVGRLGGLLIALLRTLAADLAEFAAALFTGEALDKLPDWTPSLVALGGLWNGISALLVRVRDWSMAITAGQPTFDPVAVALVWSLALWVVAAWASWWVRRNGRPLPGTVPAGILLGGSTFYVAGNPAFLLPLLGATWLLVVLVGQGGREQRWSATGVDYPLDVGYEVVLVGAALSVVLVTTAMLVPSISVGQVVEWTARLFQRPADQAPPAADWLGLNRPASGSPTFFDQATVRAPGLPRRHLIGSGPELSQRVVMVIYPQAASPIEGESTPGLVPEPAAQYYWRSLTYDQYNGRGWIAGRTQTQEYRAGDVAVFRDRSEPPSMASPAVSSSPHQRQVRMQVRAAGDLGELLYAAGDLLTADQDYRVAWRSSQDAFGATLALTGPRRGDLDGGEASQAVETGQATATANPIIYRTDSLVPAIGETQLRTAGAGYPAWVQDHYLSLPDEVPARVLALARDLTATALSPYDRARAIEAYLRTFPYNLDLPPPPQNRDVVDYFLFDLQQGYCDYYATTMVVLARAAGLPARLAVGYFSGTYDETNTRYIVTEADAHSWAEIYFPHYGWIEFEPTAGRAAIDRPADVPPSVPGELEALQPLAPQPIPGSQFWWLVLPALVILAGLGSLAWSVVDGWRLRRLAPQTAAVVLYGRFYQHGRRLAVPARPGDTPYEFVTSFGEYVLAIARAGRWAAVLTPAVQEARWLADLYVQTCYGPHPPGSADREQAIRTWRRLRRRLWLARTCQAGSFVSNLTSAFSRPARRAGHLPTS